MTYLTDGRGQCKWLASHTTRDGVVYTSLHQQCDHVMAMTSGDGVTSRRQITSTSRVLVHSTLSLSLSGTFPILSHFLGYILPHRSPFLVHSTSHTHARTHARTYTPHTHTHAHTYIHTRARTHAHTHTHTLAQHTHTHTRTTHTHTLTHTHTH